MVARRSVHRRSCPEFRTKFVLGVLCLASVVVGQGSASAAGGDQLWDARFHVSGGGSDSATSVAVSPDGSRVFVAGQSGSSATSSDYATLAFDAVTGERLWEARYNGPGNSSDSANGLAVSPDGTRVYVTGSSYGVGSSSDYATIAYNTATGAQVWEARYNGPAASSDAASSIVVTRDGTRVFVTGPSVGVGTSSDYATVSYDASSGVQLWSARYNGPANRNEYASSIAVSRDGVRVFVTGSLENPYSSYYNTDYATVAYNASTGAQLWASGYDGNVGNNSGSDNATSIAVSPDGGRVYVTGTSYYSATYYDYVTLAYNAATGGAFVAGHRFSGPSNDYDSPKSLAVSPDGSRVYVTGQSYQGSSYDYLTVAYTASTLTPLWSATYVDVNDDAASSLTLSPDGSRLYVTGRSYSSTSSYNYVTLAYNTSTGARFWAIGYNGPSSSDDSASAVAVDPSGTRIFVTGYSHGSGTSSDYATVAYNAGPGTQAWQSRYDGPGNGADQASSMVVSPDGRRVFVTGQSHGSGTSLDYATVAYDAATGVQLWQSFHNGPGDGADLPTDIAISSDGRRLYVTGQAVGLGSSFDYATVVYDAETGTRVWQASYNGPGNGSDMASDVSLSPDGALVYVTGKSWGSASSFDYATVAYDAATAAQVWVSRYNGPTSGDDIAVGLEASSDGGRVYVTGQSVGSGTSTDYATLSYDATTGTQVWLQRYNGSANSWDEPAALAVSSDGSRVIVTGRSVGSGTYSDYATISYESIAGTEVWAKRFNGAADSTDEATSLKVSPDSGRVFVTGRSFAPGTYLDYETLAYEGATGASLWQTRYNGSGNGNDYPSRLVVSTDGSRVFVTGRSAGSGTGDDYATIALNSSTGAGLWTMRYNGPANSTDVPVTLAASADGSRVFVTGSSTGSGTSSDFLTLAYSALVEVPWPPQDLAGGAGPGRGEISLTWRPPSTDGGTAVSGYRIYRRQPDSPTPTLLAEVAASTPAYRDRGLPDGATLLYRVTAVNAAGEGAPSNEVTASTFGPPSEPRNFAVALGPAIGQNTLTWQAPSSSGGIPILKYRVYRAMLPGARQLIAEVSGNSTSYIDASCTLGSICAYTLTADNGLFEGNPTNEVHMAGTAI